MIYPKSIILCLLQISIISIGFTQSFVKTIRTTEDEVSSSVVNHHEGGYIQVISRGEFNFSHENYHYTDIIYQLNDNGDITDSLILPQDDDYYIQTPRLKQLDNNYLLYSNIFDKDNYGHPGLLLSLISSNLDILEYKTFFQSDTGRVLYECLENMHGTLVILGSEAKLNGNSTNNYLWELDQDWDIIKRTSFDFNIYNYLVELPSIEGYHIGGFDSIFQVGYDFSHQGVVFGKNYDDSLFFYNSRKSITDSSYAICAISFEHNPPMFTYDFGVAFFNQSGEKTSQLQFGAPDIDDYSYCVDFVTPDSIMVGGERNYIHNEFWGFGNHDTWYSVYNTAQNGDLHWFFDYGGDGCYNLKSILATNDGGCLLTGTFWDWRNNPIYERDVILVKIDRFGVITSINDTQLSNKNQVDIFPNPGHNTLHINMHSQSSIFELYDVKGRLIIYKELQDNQLELNTSALRSGLYLYHIRCDEGHAFRGKWIKE